MAALAIVCANTAGADVAGKQTDEATQQAMLGMQYADEQACFIIMGNEVQPVLPLLVASDGRESVGHDQVIAALDAALGRGCDINQPDLHGFSPLNTAITQGNLALTRYLLEHGADPAMTITSNHPEINGLDSFALLELLRSKNPGYEEQWQKLDKLLYDF